MATPTEKHPDIANLVNYLAGRSREKCVRADICVWCGEPAKEFRDRLSEKEYSISGLCQKCQDDTFGTD